MFDETTHKPSINFDNYKFRPSSLDHLITKSEILSETAKKVLNKIFIKDQYGIDEDDLTSLAVMKGTTQEDDSIDLYRKFSGNWCKKYVGDKIQNDWIIGTPDLILKNKIVDIKTSYDIFTFTDITEKDGLSRYQWQVRAYCWLLNKPAGELAFCNTSHSPEFLEREFKKRSWGMDEKQLFDLENWLQKRFVYDGITIQNRVKIFQVNFNPVSDVQLLQKRLTMCREYLNSLI